MRFILAIYCSNTSSVAVNRATFLATARSRSGSDSPRGCHSFPSRRFATHWRRLIVTFVSELTKSTPATLLYAGVQTMRARICSASSCDMFARVAWLRLRRAAKLPTFALFYAARTRHAWLARLTRARGKSSQREGKALFDDFWYFWSYKSTRKENVSL